MRQQRPQRPRALRIRNPLPAIARLGASMVLLLAVIGVDSAAADKLDRHASKAFGHLLPGVTADRFPQMIHGKAVFNRVWQAPGTGNPQSGGLGPLYNAASCADCHFRDGRGGREHAPPPLIYRLSGHSSESSLGPQLQDHHVNGIGEGRVTVQRQPVAGRFADGSPFELSQPRYTLQLSPPQPGPAPTPGPRLPPTLVGLGLLEAVPAASIVAWADPEDRDGDGISGRAHWVGPRGEERLGRFGWQATHPSLEAQITNALYQDMGIIAPRFADARTEAEIAEQPLRQLVAYVRLLAPPPVRDAAPGFAAGEQLFQRIGCADCHRPELRTGTAQLAETADQTALAAQTIRPYTDLLLHDLGPALADQGDNTSEWRTAPLWGLGLLPAVNGHLRLLHDGRAQSFAEAILWHGGEATASREAFRQLSADERRVLLTFLRGI